MLDASPCGRCPHGGKNKIVPAQNFRLISRCESCKTRIAYADALSARLGSATAPSGGWCWHEEIAGYAGWDIHRPRGANT